MSPEMSKALGKDMAVLQDPIAKQPRSRKKTSTQSSSQWSSCTDIWIYRIVVGFLGTTLLTAIAGGIFLQINDKETPAIVTALGTGALGAMTTLLAASPIKKTRR
jgi:hypothetical protein